jgi:UDP-N-acetylmuramyl pentapeptide synthase
MASISAGPFREKVKAKVVTYSLSGEAMISGAHYVFDERTGVGCSFKLQYEGTSIPVRLPHIIGGHLITSVLAAAAVGVALKINPVSIVKALESFESLPGRMRLIAGQHGTLLLDDSYNASPDSVRAALITLSKMRAGRKIVVLGDMLDLGPNADTFHTALTAQIFSMGLSSVFLLGEKARLLRQTLVASGFSQDRTGSKALVEPQRARFARHVSPLISRQLDNGLQCEIEPQRLAPTLQVKRARRHLAEFPPADRRDCHANALRHLVQRHPPRAPLDAEGFDIEA